jgi:hypothetical protein
MVSTPSKFTLEILKTEKPSVNVKTSLSIDDIEGMHARHETIEVDGDLGADRSKRKAYLNALATGPIDLFAEDVAVAQLRTLDFDDEPDKAPRHYNGKMIITKVYGGVARAPAS